jgi:hypothetical protein
MQFGLREALLHSLTCLLCVARAGGSEVERHRGVVLGSECRPGDREERDQAQRSHKILAVDSKSRPSYAPIGCH